MITISLCMIVKNEETLLARCLDSVKEVADEIIVVDTGSTDLTKEIAKIYTENVFDFPWIDDFSAARNFSFSKATMEYCMWIDADDVILEKDRNALIKLKETLSPDTDIVMLRYNTGFDEVGNPTFSFYRERILRRGAGFQWKGAVHEAITPYGKIQYEEISVTHRKASAGDPDRNLRIFEKLIAEGQSLEPREQFYYARELYYHGRDGDAVQILETFLNEGKGWLENNIEACRILSLCLYRLSEPDAALRALLRSLEYDIPRAEFCCDIGKHFMDRNRYSQSIYWYELALTCERDDRTCGFILPDCYDYIPYLQLCVCYDRMRDREKAQAYNEKAGACKPNSPAYRYNKRYFEEQK